jgi:hypothetical protein
VDLSSTYFIVQSRSERETGGRGALHIAFFVISGLLCDHRTGQFVILALDSLSYTDSNVIVNFKRAPASRGGQMLPDSPFKICAGEQTLFDIFDSPSRA